MSNTEYITIKNASRKVLNRMRQIGVDKAQRLQEVQKRWDAGEYKNSEIVQLWIMEDFVRIFRSSTGDVYHIALSEDHSVLSSEAIDAMHDVNVVGIELRRLAGKNTTGQEVLAVIESTIAEFFAEHENVIICYYCDFINPIPHTSKNTMPPQEYRSRLFAKMFQRYSRQHGITDVRLSVVEINGINEKYFFHVIYRETHSLFASLIGRDLKEGFDKWQIKQVDLLTSHLQEPQCTRLKDIKKGFRSPPRSLKKGHRFPPRSRSKTSSRRPAIPFVKGYRSVIAQP